MAGPAPPAGLAALAVEREHAVIVVAGTDDLRAGGELPGALEHRLIDVEL